MDHQDRSRPRHQAVPSKELDRRAIARRGAAKPSMPAHRQGGGCVPSPGLRAVTRRELRAVTRRRAACHHQEAEAVCHRREEEAACHRQEAEAPCHHQEGAPCHHQEAEAACRHQEACRSGGSVPSGRRGLRAIAAEPCHHQEAEAPCAIARTACRHQRGLRDHRQEVELPETKARSAEIPKEKKAKKTTRKALLAPLTWDILILSSYLIRTTTRSYTSCRMYVIAWKSAVISVT